MAFFDFNVANVLNAVSGGSPLSIIDSVLHPSYVIRKHGSADVALPFNGMSVIQPGGRATIVTAPVEKGRYQAINKIYQPGRLSCQIVISGLTGVSGALPDIFSLTLTSQSTTLDTLVDMLKSTDLYDIETPKASYDGYDLVDYGYQVSSQSGPSLLIVALTFQEVIQQMDVVLSSAQARKKPTNDNNANTPWGVCDVEVSGSQQETTVDELSTAWDSLKKSVGNVIDNTGNKIESSFHSALKTAGHRAADVLNSTTDKVNTLTKNITDTLT